MPNFISVTASIAELAHGERSRTQSLTQLIWSPRNHSTCTSEYLFRALSSSNGVTCKVPKTRTNLGNLFQRCWTATLEQFTSPPSWFGTHPSGILPAAEDASVYLRSSTTSECCLFLGECITNLLTYLLVSATCKTAYPQLRILICATLVVKMKWREMTVTSLFTEWIMSVWRKANCCSVHKYVTQSTLQNTQKSPNGQQTHQWVFFKTVINQRLMPSKPRVRQRSVVNLLMLMPWLHVK